MYVPFSRCWESLLSRFLLCGTLCLQWNEDDPENRQQWQSQHNGLKYLDPPYVYNVFKDDTEGFVAAVEQALANPIDGYILPRMKREAVEERLAAVLEHDWKKEAEALLEERIRAGGKVCVELLPFISAHSRHHLIVVKLTACYLLIAVLHMIEYSASPILGSIRTSCMSCATACSIYGTRSDEQNSGTTLLLGDSLNVVLFFVNGIRILHGALSHTL